MAAGKDTADGRSTCLCDGCGRMPCRCGPERDMQPGLGATLAQVLLPGVRRQAGREAGS
jgi:hypothetical protein